MEDNILGTTVLDQMPPEFRSGGKHKGSRLILILIGLLVLISIAYWFYNRSTKNSTTISESQTSETASGKTADSDVSDLQAAAANLAIPDFSKNF